MQSWMLSQQILLGKNDATPRAAVVINVNARWVVAVPCSPLRPRALLVRRELGGRDYFQAFVRNRLTALDR
jgi:hypothetical protein